MLISYILVFVSIIISIYSLKQSKISNKQLESNQERIKNLELLLERWIKRYDNDSHEYQLEKDRLEEEIVSLKKKVRNLEYIVNKVDETWTSNHKNFSKIKRVL